MPGFNFDQMSREELVERARDMGIPGVENMSREQIIDALKGGGQKAGILD